VEEVDGDERGGGEQVMRPPLERLAADLEHRLDDDGDDDGLEARQHPGHGRDVAVCCIDVRQPE
jgi:hypothetical protein